MTAPVTSPPAVASSPAVVPPSNVRRQISAASRRIARLKRIDRAAVGVITLGGVAVVIAVLGILIFIAAEAIPLFRSASVHHRASFATEPVVSAATRTGALGADEYQRYVFTVEADGRVVFRRLSDGEEAHVLSVPDLNAAVVTASSSTLLDHFVAAALSDSRISLFQVRFSPVFTEQTLTDVSPAIVARGTVRLDSGGGTPSAVSYREQDGQKFVAVASTGRITYWWTDAEGTEHRTLLPMADESHITQLRVGRNGHLIAATDRGQVYHWELGDEPMLTDVSTVSEESVTALEWALGGNSFIAGASDGRISNWFRAPVHPNGDYGMVRAHEFDPQGAPIVALVVSPRDRTFATIGGDGSIVLRHQTSERTLSRTEGREGVVEAVMTPRANGLVTRSARALDHYAVDNPHPEISWATLFGKVWYEGYEQPEYVWQSTGATDDFESKFSLTPLVFGTIKGTFYALLFAIPLAVFGALYTSQFVHPGVRANIKPTIEIMAALPSVVIGFLAGLYLAPVIERHLAAVFLMPVLLTLFGTSGVFVWRLLPARLARRLPVGTEIFLLLPLVAAAIWLALWAGPNVEAAVFAGDTRQWLHDTFGITYDQRNCLVVGLAMGFAVIPIIFTISEDAFSSVPPNLTAASLALGASRWQTAVRVVLPTASPGIFSAVMVGFGRAVGETMIVLMATGNTPVLDWSMFNGMRTLSANIAVEIPEAPHGGTLYRVLFLAATILFVMTFAVNTVAELIRQRLRERYRAV